MSVLFVDFFFDKIVTIHKIILLINQIVKYRYDFTLKVWYSIYNNNNNKDPQKMYRLGTVSKKIPGA